MVPLLVDMIFQHLTVEELCKMKLVCKMWRTTSEKILHQRSEVLQIDFMTSVKLTTDNSSFINEFMSWKKNWRHIPNIVLCVLQTSKHVKTEIDDLTGSWFPDTCPFLMVETERGLVCSDPNKTEIEDEPDTMGFVAYCNLLAMPKFPMSVSVDVICLPEEPADNESEVFLNSLSQKINHGEIKFLMMFYSKTGRAMLEEKLADNLTDAYKRGIVILGCEFETPVILHNNGQAKDQNSAKKSLVAISFLGKNIKCASLHIDVDVTSIRHLDRKVKMLKDTTVDFSQSCPNHSGNLNNYGYCNVCNSQTLGFVIANYIKGDAYDWYEETEDDPRRIRYNQEQEAFRIAFPKVPLFGCFGEGEIGTSVNLGPLSDSEELFKSESTIFGVLFLKE